MYQLIRKYLSFIQKRKSMEEHLAPLDERFRSVLISMYRGEPQRGMDGKKHLLDPKVRISPSQGMYLYDLCILTKPESTLEIGLAYGYSTIYFLASIAKNQKGYHVAIDPYAKSKWHGIGLACANALAPVLGNGAAFKYLEERSDRASTDLLRAGNLFDVIFIDGNHRFDDVLVDFYLYAQLCSMGGYIIFDDAWMRSVRTVVSFIRSNRTDFLEIKLMRPNFRVFQKIDRDTRDWPDFHWFPVS